MKKKRVIVIMLSSITHNTSWNSTIASIEQKSVSIYTNSALIKPNFTAKLSHKTDCPKVTDVISCLERFLYACRTSQQRAKKSSSSLAICNGGARNYGQGGRSKEIMDMGGGPKSFNHKITECSLFVWIFTLWMSSSKDKIQIYVILLSRSYPKIYNKAFIISF
jgi:hypothetical protein